VVEFDHWNADMSKKPNVATVNGKAERHGVPSEILTPSGLAVFLQLPEAVVVAEAQAGRIPGRCIAGEWRFLRSAIADWFEHVEVRSERPIVGVGRDFDEDPEAIIASIYRERKRHPWRG
jgi:hypothetical protein